MAQFPLFLRFLRDIKDSAGPLNNFESNFVSLDLWSLATIGTQEFLVFRRPSYIAICDGPQISAISAISAGLTYPPSVMAPFCAICALCATIRLTPLLLQA